MVKFFCDGGSRGNPGPAAAAFVVEEDGKVIYKGSKFLGKTTNNVAEYSAVVLALSWLEKNLDRVGTKNITVILDSELVAKQMAGFFKIKNENLRNYFLAAKTLENKIGIKITYESVRRTENTHADLLVNQTLDRVNKQNLFPKDSK